MAIRAQRYKKSIALDVADGLYVLGQPDRIRQLFINLLDNAIKYSSSRSEISVRAQADGDRGAVRFVFANQGPDLDPEQLESVFEPFYSADRRFKEEGSVGLGLSIVRSIVDDHGGTIRMTSQDGWTSVSAELPAAGSERT